MAGLLIIAHQPLASALRQVASHVFPDEPVEAIDVAPDADPEQLRRHARQLLEMVRDPEALVMADVRGGTPANVAEMLAEAGRVRVVTGVNVPMLWRVLNHRAKPLDKLVELAIQGAQEGAMRLGTTPPQNQAQRAAEDDQVHAHHQQ